MKKQFPVGIGKWSSHSRETWLRLPIQLYSSPKTHGHAMTQVREIQKLFRLRWLSWAEIFSPSLLKAWQPVPNPNQEEPFWRDIWSFKKCLVLKRKKKKRFGTDCYCCGWTDKQERRTRPIRTIYLKTSINTSTKEMGSGYQNKPIPCQALVKCTGLSSGQALKILLEV